MVDQIKSTSPLGVRAAAVAFAALACLGSAPLSALATPQPAPRVSARLVVGGAGIAGGAEFPVGVLLQIEPGWHIYWINPGDSGLATSVQLIAPEGFAVGPLRWPVPRRFDQAGGLRGFGYEDSVLLSAPVRAPSPLGASRDFTFRADVQWLACAATCIPGRASVALTVPAGRGVGGAGAVFATWAPRLPLEPDAADLPFTARRTHGPNRRVDLTLEWKSLPPRMIEYFPGADPAVEVDDASIETKGRTTHIVFDARSLPGRQPTGARSPDLVVWSDLDGQRRGAWLSMSVD